MPFSITPRDKAAAGPFKVINSDTGSVKGTHPTWAKAVKQLRALYVNVPDARTESFILSHVHAVLMDIDTILDEFVGAGSGMGGPPSGGTGVAGATTSANVGPYEKPFPWMLKRQVPELLGSKKKKKQLPQPKP